MRGSRGVYSNPVLSTGVVLQVAPCSRHHQVNVQKKAGSRVHRLHHQRPEGQAAHKTPVHNVQVNPAHPCRLSFLDGLREPPEIGGENGGGDKGGR